MAIKLAQRPLKDNKISLLLDHSPPLIVGNKSRRWEFLKLFLYAEINEKGRAIKLSTSQKNHNRETLKSVKEIIAIRTGAMHRDSRLTLIESEAIKEAEKQNESFLDFVKELGKGRKESNARLWENVHRFIESYRGNVTFKEVTESYVKGFRTYLLSVKQSTPKEGTDKRRTQRALSPNTASMYLATLMNAIKKAQQQGYIKTFIESLPIEKEPTEIAYLTADELKKLFITPTREGFHFQQTKQAALFSALTGLRGVDIKNLTWNKIKEDDNGVKIVSKIQKTSTLTYKPITKEARDLLGERKNPTDLIFTDLKTEASRFLVGWLGSAGITKPITFHSFRHTFATSLLNAKVDLYTISKLLDHKSVRSSERYAQISDESLKNAISKISISNG